MSKSTLQRPHLSKDEIDEELLNNELINSGGVENEDSIKEMNIEEKKDMLRGIKQSKDECFSKPSTRSSNQQAAFDTSPANFPLLAGKSFTKNKLKLPRRSPGTKTVECDGSSDKYINLLDEESVVVKFNLPFGINDGAPPLLVSERRIRNNKNAYYVVKGETPAAALKRMLCHHDKWKDAYTAEISNIESHALGKDIENSDSRGHDDSTKSNKVDDKENDPHSLVEFDSPVSIVKVYNGPRKRETNANSEGCNSQQSSRLLQRKTSRDSDCEEIETILKPEEPKDVDWQPFRPRSKRNRKQLFNQEKNQGSPDVEFEFENKWDSRSSTWNATQSSSSSSLNNQIQARKSLSSTSVIEEEKVQCPICQRNFALSKVENHAATCEGYSGSPMDVEEEN